MEFWPADFRADAPTSAKERRKGKEVYRLNSQNIEPGTLGAATLIWGQAYPRWITAVQPKSRFFPRLLGRPVEVFPPTKPPPIQVPKLTIHRRAQQGVSFLRTYYPDFEFSLELIKDELQRDEEAAARNSVLDPYAGNRIVHFSMETTRKQLTPFLAFACGMTGSELNVSAFRLIGDNNFVFNPSATPTMSFDTPIQQIMSFSPKGATSQNVAFLVARTHGVVSILKLQSTASGNVGEPPAVVKAIIPVSVSETEKKRRIVDMSCGSFSSFNTQILLVNDMGSIYDFQIQGGRKALSPFADVLIDEDVEPDRFWRLAWRDTQACMRASSKIVHLFDLRAAQPRELFRLSDTREYLTSIEAPLENRYSMCFATTNKILWFDERNSKRPVLTLKHQRAFDRSLRIESVIMGQYTLTALSSAANHLVTVYDVNYASSGHMEMHGVPFMLPGSSNLELPVAGSLIFQPFGTKSTDYLHFQLSSRGSLWKTNISFFSEEVEQASDDVSLNDYEWTDEVHALASKSKAMAEDVGNLGERNHFITNLRGIYEKIYSVQYNIPQATEEDAEAFYQTLERIPFFWQEMDGTTEYMLTTFDVAFKCGLEPLHASRADFLTESPLNSPRGYAALIGGRIPIPRLISTAPWHYDMGSLPSTMVPDMPTPSQTLFDTLREEAIPQAATPHGMQRATEAAQNLVLDLALSRHVYAPQGYSKAGVNVSEELDGAEMLSRATKALSLGGAEPPLLQFGFLRPITKVLDDDKQLDGADGNLKLQIPLGVRLLLSQWDVGSSPDEYSYVDPYEAQEGAPLATSDTHGTDGFRQQASIPTVIAASRPPAVVSSKSLQVVTGQWRPLEQTASIPENHVILRGSSPIRQPPRPFSGVDVPMSQGNTLEPTQEFLGPSTQPLPGPFGRSSRMLGTRKSVGKKRMGGF